MDVTDVKLNYLNLSGNDKGSGLLLSQRAYYEYVDGKKTGNQLGITYDAVFPDNNYEKISVKVASTQVVITDEELKKNCGKIRIRFTNLSGRFYHAANGSGYKLSCHADGIEVIA